MYEINIFAFWIILALLLGTIFTLFTLLFFAGRGREEDQRRLWEAGVSIAELDIRRILEVHERNTDIAQLSVALHVLAEEAFKLVGRDYKELDDQTFDEFINKAMAHDHEFVAKTLRA